MLVPNAQRVNGPGAPIEDPTARERQVLDLVARGYDNRAIAAELGLGYETVHGHVRALIAKAGARSRVELIALAYRRGLVSGSDR